MPKVTFILLSVFSSEACAIFKVTVTLTLLICCCPNKLAHCFLKAVVSLQSFPDLVTNPTAKGHSTAMPSQYMSDHQIGSLAQVAYSVL